MLSISWVSGLSPISETTRDPDSSDTLNIKHKIKHYLHQNSLLGSSKGVADRLANGSKDLQCTTSTNFSWNVSPDSKIHQNAQLSNKPKCFDITALYRDEWQLTQTYLVFTIILTSLIHQLAKSFGPKLAEKNLSSWKFSIKCPKYTHW